MAVIVIAVGEWKFFLVYCDDNNEKISQVLTERWLATRTLSTSFLLSFLQRNNVGMFHWNKTSQYSQEKL